MEPTTRAISITKLYGQTPTRIRIYNNVSMNRIFVDAVSFAETTVYNNIWQKPVFGNKDYFIAISNPAQVPGLSSDNNFFYTGSRPGAKAFRDYPEKRSLLEWRSAFEFGSEPGTIDTIPPKAPTSLQITKLQLSTSTKTNRG